MKRPPVPMVTNTKTTASDQKPGVFTMASNRPPARAPQPSTTPVSRRVANAQRSTPSPSSLHPNVTTRSPRSSAGRKSHGGADLRATSPDAAARTPTRPQSSYVARPTSAVGVNRGLTRNDATISSYPGNAQSSEPANSNSNRTSRFFHASEINATKSQQTTSSNSSKFFHVESVQHPTGPPPAPRLARTLQPAPHLGPPAPALTPTHTNHRPAVSPPPSRPSSKVGHRASFGTPLAPTKPSALTPSTAPDNRNHVKFVYANGTEEILPPRKGSEAGSTTSSPQLPSSPLYSGYPSPLKANFPLSPTSTPNPLASPPVLYRSPHSPISSRRSSGEVKIRHDRTLSIGSALDIAQVPEPEQNVSSEEMEGSGDEAKSSESVVPPATTAKERIQAMEEAAANARRERKVMDLEISNTSLMAINKALEREMRKQSAELRRYRRLSRSGRLSITPSVGRSSLGSMDRRDTLGSELYESSILESQTEYSDWEQQSADEDTPSDDFDEEPDGSEDSNSVNDEKHRASDERRLTVDISKHQALLDASARMNMSLKRCNALTDQLINEGRRALEYKVKPSDVQLGGRILHEDEDDYEGGVTIDREELPILAVSEDPDHGQEGEILESQSEDVQLLDDRE